MNVSTCDKDYICCTHNLAVKVVLLDHDNVDRLGVLEREEAESTRATRDAVTHHCALKYLTKL